jgi:phage tail tape-measure protein
MAQSFLANELNNQEEMKKPLEVWHIVIAIISTMIACWGIIYMYSKDSIQAARTVENHEIRITELEKIKAEDKEYRKSVDAKIDKITDQNTQILIILQNKQDRK